GTDRVLGDDPVLLKQLQAFGEDALGYLQVALEFIELCRAPEQFANDQQVPPVAQYIYRTAARAIAILEGNSFHVHVSGRGGAAPTRKLLTGFMIAPSFRCFGSVIDPFRRAIYRRSIHDQATPYCDGLLCRCHRTGRTSWQLHYQ